MCGAKCSTSYYHAVWKRNLTFSEVDRMKFDENVEALNCYIEQLDVCGPRPRVVLHQKILQEKVLMKLNKSTNIDHSVSCQSKKISIK